MAFKAFVRQNVVLAVGLALPILVMAAFMLASGLPRQLADPPRYNLVFSTFDYSPGSQAFPVSPKFIVRDGALHAQFTRMPRQPGYVNSGWKKLYLYDAATQKVRELPFGLPPDVESIDVMREDPVDSARDLVLDTTLQSPDGYELTFGTRTSGGFFNEFLWRSRDTYGARLARKDGSSVRLATADGQGAFSMGSVEFVGWVTGSGARR
jgi:hypothetical protein